jgi:hypothetical protein
MAKDTYTRGKTSSVTLIISTIILSILSPSFRLFFSFSGSEFNCQKYLWSRKKKEKKRQWPFS